MTRAKQKLCLGSPLFQCSKRAKSSDFVCDECSTRRIDAKRVRFSNYFIFAGEEGSYVCQNPRISAHKFRFVTQFIHMIVFASGEDAAAATEKVNATRGAQYGLHPAHRLPIGKVVLEQGFPCALNKHQHRLLPDASTFQDVDIEYLDGGMGDSPPHTHHRSGSMPFGPVGAAGGMPRGPHSPTNSVDAKSGSVSPRGGRSSSIIDISAPSGTLTSMMRRSSSNAGGGGSAISRTPTTSSLPLVGVSAMMASRQGRWQQHTSPDAGGASAETTRMSVARHFGEEFDENTLCSTAWNRMSRRSKLLNEQRLSTSPHSSVRASSPPRAGAAGGGGQSPTNGNSRGAAAAFMPSHRPPTFMRSSSAAVTSGLSNVILPNNGAGGQRGVKRHRSSSSVGDHPYSPTASAPTGDDAAADGGDHVAGPGSSRSSSPPKRARVSPYMFAAGGGSVSDATTPATGGFAFDTNTPRGGLNTPRGDGADAGAQTSVSALLTYQMHNLFPPSTPTGGNGSSTPAVSGGGHSTHNALSAATAAAAASHASTQNMSSGGGGSGTAGSLGNVASARDLFPTDTTAGTGDSSCALPPLDSTLSGPTLSPLNDKTGAAGLDTSQVQSWLDKFQESQAIQHRLDMHRRQQQAAYLQQHAAAAQTRPFGAIGDASSGGTLGVLAANALGSISDPTAHLSL